MGLTPTLVQSSREITDKYRGKTIEHQTSDMREESDRWGHKDIKENAIGLFKRNPKQVSSQVCFWAWTECLKWVWTEVADVWWEWADPGCRPYWIIKHPVWDGEMWLLATINVNVIEIQLANVIGSVYNTMDCLRAIKVKYMTLSLLIEKARDHPFMQKKPDNKKWVG